MNRLSKNPLPFDLKGCYLAGGAILSTVTKKEISDYDIYPKSKKDMIDIFYQLEDGDCFIVNFSDRAVTWKCNSVTNDKGERAIIQVMTFDEFTSPSMIFDYFDFTVCMGAFDVDTKEYHFHSDFWPSVSSRTLYFNPKTKFPLNSAIRVGKYTAKGYFLPKTESIKMSLAVINNGMPSSWEQLEAAIGGTYGKSIKINSEGKEFSYENVLELLDTIVLDYQYDERDYSEIKAEMLEDFFANGKVKVFKYEKKNEWSSTSYTNYHTITQDGRIGDNITGHRMEAYERMGVELEEIDGDTIFYGYKTLRDKGDGTYVNIINSKKLPYRLGMETTEPKYPHIFLYPKPLTKEGYITAKFSFRARHIRNISGHEYQVEYVKFEEIL